MTSHIDQFVATIARLRAPDGCPWDKEQDHRSLGRFLLEEAYEVLEAIHAEDDTKLREELGDLLLQIVLHAQIASEAGQFDFEDVAQGINEKMISRHPHVFGDASAENAGQVLKQWEELKHAEQQRQGNQSRSPVDNVPNALPALLKALKVSEKAVSHGFEWRDFDELWTKVQSEMDELHEVLVSPESCQRNRNLELELGDVLFCLVNVGRWNGLNAEEALLLAIDKFRERYRMMETLSAQPLKELSKDQLGKLWVRAKAAVNS